MELKPGARYKSVVSDTEVVVVRAPAGEVSLECGGHPMVPMDADRPSGLELDPAFAAPTLMGKRFADPDSGTELLASKGGDGTLAVNGTPIPLKDAKPLPASD